MSDSSYDLRADRNMLQNQIRALENKLALQPNSNTVDRKFSVLQLEQMRVLSQTLRTRIELAVEREEYARQHDELRTAIRRAEVEQSNRTRDAVRETLYYGAAQQTEHVEDAAAYVSANQKAAVPEAAYAWAERRAAAGTASAQVAETGRQARRAT